MKAAKATLRRPEGAKALDYLKNVRRLSEEVIDKLNMGYCPSDLHHQLAGRIITPIYDLDGELIAVSTRHLDRDHPQRFWHESFDKGLYVYGLNWAKEAIQDSDKVIFVEGEFDVAAMYQAIFPIVVGACGGTISLYQISLVARYCKNFYLMFDGDRAGQEAANRAMHIYRSNDLDIYGLKFFPCLLPEELDPDDVLKKYGRGRIVESLKDATKKAKS